MTSMIETKAGARAPRAPRRTTRPAKPKTRLFWAARVNGGHRLRELSPKAVLESEVVLLAGESESNELPRRVALAFEARRLAGLAQRAGEEITAATALSFAHDLEREGGFRFVQPKVVKCDARGVTLVRVPSLTDASVRYDVYVSREGGTHCDCGAWHFYGDCKHSDMARTHLRERAQELKTEQGAR